MRVFLWSALVVLAGTVVFAQQPQTRKVFVEVVDAANAPVDNLTAADFQVKENGLARTVTRVMVNQPVRLALMVDNSDASTQALTPIRAGVHAFIDAMPSNVEIVLLTTGRQMRIRVPPTVEHKKLHDAVGIIYPDAGSPSVLLSSLIEAFDRFFKNVPNRSEMIVMLTTDGPENSNMNPKQFNELANRLQASGVLVHAIILANRGVGMQSDAAMMLAQNSGGHVDELTAPNGLADRMKTLGELVARDCDWLSRQYQIEYSTDGAPAGIEVALTRPGLRSTVSVTMPR